MENVGKEATSPQDSSSAAITSILRCPVDGAVLRQEGDTLICPICGPVGTVHGRFISFLPNQDQFYEGRYFNRIHHVPRADNFVATLPIRFIGKGYHTTIARQLPVGSRVLELGCAAGIDWFAKRYEMWGLDLSRSSLEALCEDYHVALQASALALPFADNTVDGVISSCLFEHFTPEDKQILLAEALRVLRPGGAIIFYYDMTTRNSVIAPARKAQPELYQTLFLDGDGHVGYEDAEANDRHFRNAGFANVRHVYHERTPLLPNSVWEKLRKWPGRRGKLGAIGHRLTSGVFHKPALAAIGLADVTVGRMLPKEYARVVTTTAQKPQLS